MKKNVGIYDTIIRLVIAIVIAILCFIGIFKEVWGIVMGIFAAVMLITGLTGFCGIYALIGIRTKFA